MLDPVIGRHERKGFTLIELLVVIAIIATLSVIVVLVLNPAELLARSRDANRISDLATIANTIDLYQTDQLGSANFSLGNASSVYVSLEDTSPTCGDQGLAPFPYPISGYSYSCASPTSSQSINGSGWIPLDLNDISSGAPIGSLPLDPVNQSSTGLYYTYMTDGTNYEVTAQMESEKYKENELTDGGSYANLYEKGTSLALLPMDYGTSTYQFIQTETATNSGSVSASFTCQHPGDTVFIAAENSYGGTTAFTISDTLGSTIIPISTLGQQGGGTPMELWYIKECSSGPDTFTVDWNSYGYTILIISEYRGPQALSLDAYATSTGFTDAVNGSVVASSNELVVAFLASYPANVSNNSTVALGYFPRNDYSNYVTGQLFDSTYSYSGVNNFSANLPYILYPGSNWALIMASFK